MKSFSELLILLMKNIMMMKIEQQQKNISNVVKE
jgi:hypothetical protein